MQKLILLSLLLPFWTFAQRINTIQTPTEVYPDSSWDRIANPGDYGWDIKEAEQNKTAYFHFGYGYLWWVWDAPYNKGVYEGAYTASGAFGQFITVVPKLDLVIAHKTKYEYERQVPTEIYLKILDKLLLARKKED